MDNAQALARLAELRKQLTDNRPIEERAKTNIPFFDWNISFSDVFSKGGFDIVIGNPPYIDSETMTRVMPEMRELYSSHFSCAKGNWDMFVVFIDLGMSLLNNSGIYSFIIPNKLVAAKYAETLRSQIAQNSIVEIRDYGNVPVFKNAAVYPATIVGKIGKKKSKNIRFSVMENVSQKSIANSISADDFGDIEFWDICFQPSQHYNLFKKISRFSFLKDVESISLLGAATVSEAYLIKEVLRNDEHCDKGIRMVNTGTIDRYTNLWGYTPMQYIKGKYDYPVITEDDLYNISEKRLQQAKSNKIIVAGMSKYIEAIYDDGKTLAGKSTTIITGDSQILKFLLAVINGSIASFYTRIAYNSLKMAGGFINIGSRELEAIPIPNVTSTQRQPIIDLVDIILAKKEENPQADTTAEEMTIDNLIFDLYGLSESEREIIRTT